VKIRYIISATLKNCKVGKREVRCEVLINGFYKLGLSGYCLPKIVGIGTGFFKLYKIK